MKVTDPKVLRFIAFFKFVKALLLILTGIGALHLLHKNIPSVLDHWITVLGVDPENQYIDKALEKAASLTPHRLKFAGVASFIYAGLFLVEGTGLWREKRWGEWITVVITGSFLPLEVYEIHRDATAAKIAVLIINIAVVAYLLYRIRVVKEDAS
jgi:uncharacterized membrane protein (DUF2068 family)